MSAIESTHNEFRQQFSDLLQSTNQNQQVLKNLSSMFCIMMEKIGNPMTVGEPQSPTAQNTNSQMPSFDRMLNSGAGSAGDPLPQPKRLKIDVIEDVSDLDKLKGKAILQDEEGGATENAMFGVGNVVPEMGDGSLREPGKGENSAKSCGENRKKNNKIETEADGHVVELESGEDNSSGSRGGVDRPVSNGNATKDPTLAALNRVGPKTRGKKKQKSPTILETSACQDASLHEQVSNSLGKIGTNSATKLLVFNIHGTLVDCSLLTEPHPNSNIRITRKSSTRRFVFRPWLTKFLDRCFKNFKVAFWGIKSLGSMEDVVAEMMRRFEGMDSHKLLFC